MERAIWATSMLWVRRVRKKSPTWLTKTCVLYWSLRKAELWMMRSRVALPGAARGGFGLRVQAAAGGGGLDGVGGEGHGRVV